MRKTVTYTEQEAQIMRKVALRLVIFMTLKWGTILIINKLARKLAAQTKENSHA